MQFIRAKILNMNGSRRTYYHIASLPIQKESRNNHEKFSNVELDCHDGHYALLKSELLGSPIHDIYAAI